MATTEQRMAEYEDLFKKSQAYDPNKFQNEFQKAYGEATGYNQDLINQKSRALGELQSVGPSMRSELMGSLITNPAEQLALIARARQDPIASYSTASELLGARGQKYQDILSRALGGYQTGAQQANTAAENAWRLYQDALARSQSSGGAGQLGGFTLNTPTPTQPKEMTPQQRVEAAIASLANARRSGNIEDRMGQYHQSIIDLGRKYGLNINPEALWVKLGNQPRTPQTLMLYL